MPVSEHEPSYGLRPYSFCVHFVGLFHLFGVRYYLCIAIGVINAMEECFNWNCFISGKG